MKIWRTIQRFEGQDYVQEKYRIRHQRTLNSKRKLEISAYFTHGREFFIASEKASDVVKPLLTFYGVSSFLKGLTLLFSSTKTGSSLKPAHGLSQIDWRAKLNADASFLKLTVKSGNGTLSDFIESFGNRQNIPILMNTEYGIGLAKPNIDFGTPNLILDKGHVSLRDVLSRTKTLSPEFRIATSSENSSNPVIVCWNGHELKLYMSFMYGTDATAQVLNYRFPAETTFTTERSPLGEMDHFCATIKAEKLEDTYKYIPISNTVADMSTIGFGIQPFDNGDRLSDIVMSYITAYFLGMICRYFPDKWISLLRSVGGDKERSLILSAASEIYDDFPRMVNEILEQI